MKRFLTAAAAASAMTTLQAQPATGDVPLPHQMPLTGVIFKYHKGASQAFLERYIPGLRCQPFMGSIVCLTPVDDISSIFIRGVRCVPPQEISFTLKQGKAVGASCGVTADQAKQLSAAYRKLFGAPKQERKGVMEMNSDHESWQIGGGDILTITHWSGRNVSGLPIEKYDVRMLSQDER